jgi:hypothetical protein
VMVHVFGIIDTVAEATAPTVGVGPSAVDAITPDDVIGGLVPRPVQMVACKTSQIRQNRIIYLALSVPVTDPGMVPIEAEELVESMEKIASEAFATDDNKDAAEC